MLSTEQILNAKFTPVSKGTYSAEEVDAFLKTVAASYENSLNNNQELIKKISILADKIESYRNDEEAIKLALLDAHKMAENVNKSASEKAETVVSDAENRAKIILDGANRQSAQTIEDAKEKAKEIVDNARTAVASLTERAQIETDNTIAQAKEKAAEIVANAEEKGREIIGTSKQSYEFYSSELERIQAETAKFKSTIEEICKGQLNLLGDIPASFAVAVPAAISVTAPAVEEVPAEESVEEESVIEAEPVADA
ncbi:MAG: DivIVA domain-containing protein, partial [Clostridia bacterium]|nr:DivIVA domain-containing protein [Clostridia bacterium]